MRNLKNKENRFCKKILTHKFLRKNKMEILKQQILI
jgi:hypothetical protein